MIEMYVEINWFQQSWSPFE